MVGKAHLDSGPRGFDSHPRIGTSITFRRRMGSSGTDEAMTIPVHSNGTVVRRGLTILGDSTCLLHLQNQQKKLTISRVLVDEALRTSAHDSMLSCGGVLVLPLPELMAQCQHNIVISRITHPDLSMVEPSSSDPHQNFTIFQWRYRECLQDSIIV